MKKIKFESKGLFLFLLFLFFFPTQDIAFRIFDLGTEPYLALGRRIEAVFQVTASLAYLILIARLSGSLNHLIQWAKKVPIINRLFHIMLNKLLKIATGGYALLCGFFTFGNQFDRHTEEIQTAQKHGFEKINSASLAEKIIVAVGTLVLIVTWFLIVFNDIISDEEFDLVADIVRFAVGLMGFYFEYNSIAETVSGKKQEKDSDNP